VLICTRCKPLWSHIALHVKIKMQALSRVGGAREPVVHFVVLLIRMQATSKTWPTNVVYHNPFCAVVIKQATVVKASLPLLLHSCLLSCILVPSTFLSLQHSSWCCCCSDPEALLAAGDKLSVWVANLAQKAGTCLCLFVCKCVCECLCLPVCMPVCVVCACAYACACVYMFAHV